MRKLRRLRPSAAALAAVAAIGVGGDADAQLTPASGPITVSNTLAVAPSPRVAMDADGKFVVAWDTDVGGGDMDVFARRFDRDGTPLGTEFVVNTYTTGTQKDPGVAFLADGSGDFAIVWAGQDSNYGGILINVFDANDSPILPQEEVVNATEAGDQRTPAITGSATGFVVAWEHFPVGADNRIKARTFGLSGGGLVGPERDVVTATYLLTAPDVGVDDNGNFVVVWNGAVALGESEVFARQFDDNGVALGTEFQVNMYTTGQQGRSRVEVGPGGDFLVTWDVGAQSLPHFQQFDSTASRVGGERPAAEPPMQFANPGNTDPALADDGSFATVYVALGPNVLAEILALSFDSTGAVIDSNPADPATDELVVHDSTVGQTAGVAPRIATNGQGRYVVAYGNSGRATGQSPVPPHVAARVLAVASATTTTTTMPTPVPACGDPDGNGRTTASEALLALRTGVGSGSCPLCLCDVDGSGSIAATDALLILRASVGFVVAFACPACP
jgi:hypothetical protein